MDSSYDVPDPSDWLETPVSKLAPVETALRCQVCKDFFTTPVITSCSHTFCSLCIRRCLTNDGKCPTCRTDDQELRLRSNWVVQELVDAFQAARPGIVQLAKDVVAFKDDGRQASKKRKLDIVDTDDETLFGSKVQGRKTRSQGKVEAPVDPTNADLSSLNDGLIPCPICGDRMKEEEVFSHLDIHNEPEGGEEPAVKDTTLRDSRPFLEIGSRSRTQPKAPMERLPKLNYSLLNDNALRKKLSGLGMPTNGPRVLLVKRHTEWVNLVNSNCDSRMPRSKRELLLELDVWERSQGRQILNNSSSGPSVMDKDFDGAGWASKHDSDFQKLIAKAKGKAKSRWGMLNIIEGQSSEPAKAKTKVDNGLALEKEKSIQPIPHLLPSSASKNGPQRYIGETTRGVFLDLDAGG